MLMLSITVNVQTTDLPVLIDIIRKTLPEGVQLSIHEDSELHQEARYVNFRILHKKVFGVLML